MVTITKIGEEYNSQILEISGLSTDPKPVDQIDGVSIANGSTFKEIDTGKEYTYNESAETWHINKSASSGGGSGVDGEDGGYYTPCVTQPTTDTMQISFAPSKPDMPAVNTVTVNLPVSENSGQNPAGGLTTAQINALDGLFRIIKYEETADSAGAYAAFCEAFGIAAKTLVSISATYDGGEVAVGTALTELDGITVTATYSDGSTEVVIGYTLTGEIAEGSNTITVSYGGKTATITVVGVASGDEPGNALYGRFWPPLSQIDNWDNPEWVGVEGAVYTDYSGPYIDAGFPEAHMVRMGEKLVGTVYIRTLTNNQYGTLGYSYKVYANSDGEVATGGFTAVTPVVHRNLGQLDVNGTMYDFVLFEFNIPAGHVGRFAALQAPMKSGYFVSADKKQIDEAYRPYYTLFDFDPRDRITEPATEVA